MEQATTSDLELARADGGVPAVVTKIVASPVFAEGSLEVDVWPPARPVRVRVWSLHEKTRRRTPLVWGCSSLRISYRRTETRTIYT